MVPPMKISSVFKDHAFVLGEAAICERLRQIDGVDLHPTLFDAPLIYEATSAEVLAGIYLEYIEIAREFEVPVLIAAPTWRLDTGRVAGADVPSTINRDAVEVIKNVRDASGYDQVLLAGLLAPKNDCYDAEVALRASEAEVFHAPQANELAEAGVDCLVAQTIPSVCEAEGMARAMLATGVPSVVSFCIDRKGRVLDGIPLGDAIEFLDDRLDRALLGYKVNCSHPTFVKPELMSSGALARLIGINANASSKDHCELESSDQTCEDSLDDWADAMVLLNQKYSVQMMGGCCGTDDRYLRKVAELIREFNSDS